SSFNEQRGSLWAARSLTRIAQFKDSWKNIRQADRASLFAGGNQRSHRPGKVKRIYLIEAHFIVLQGMQQISIGAAAAAKRFDSQSLVAGLTQLNEKQSGE